MNIKAAIATCLTVIIIAILFLAIGVVGVFKLFIGAAIGVSCAVLVGLVIALLYLAYSDMFSR